MDDQCCLVCLIFSSTFCEKRGCLRKALAPFPNGLPPQAGEASPYRLAGVPSSSFKSPGFPVTPRWLGQPPTCSKQSRPCGKVA